MTSKYLRVRKSSPANTVSELIDPDEVEPYTVQSEDGRFSVLDWEGNVVLTCSDPASAEHYAALLAQAFRRGFKSGFHRGREV